MMEIKRESDESRSRLLWITLASVVAIMAIMIWLAAKYG
jgi:hypothetical protein